MNFFLLFVSVTVGAALAWVCIAWLQRRHQRTRALRCIVPYASAAQRPVPPEHSP